MTQLGLFLSLEIRYCVYFNNNTCDPIPFTVYELLLEWALESNNVIVWSWTIQQWNYLARCANLTLYVPGITLQEVMP